MKEIKILGINVLDRIKEAGKTQEVLSKHAKLIRSRMGFHELSKDVCSRNGFILLELQGEPEKWRALEDDLETIGGIQVKEMHFTF